MNLTLSPQMRVVALAGVVAIVALGGGIFFLGQRQPASDAAPSVSPQELVRRAHAARPDLKKAAPTAKAAAPAKPKPKPAAKPKPRPRVTLYQNLPGLLLAALQQHEVVVAVLYNPKAPDDQIAVAEAQAGARDAGVGFTGLNVLDQRDVGQITKTYGLINDPAVLIFRRPGSVVGRLNGFADRATVAQAVEEAAPDSVAPVARVHAADSDARATGSSRDRRDSELARARLQATIPAVEAYNADNNGYVGMTAAKLSAYDKGVENVSVVGRPTVTSYCLRSTVGAKSWYKRGPGGKLTTTPCTGP